MLPKNYHKGYYPKPTLNRNPHAHAGRGGSTRGATCFCRPFLCSLVAGVTVPTGPLTTQSPCEGNQPLTGARVDFSGVCLPAFSLCRLSEKFPGYWILVRFVVRIIIPHNFRAGIQTSKNHRGSTRAAHPSAYSPHGFYPNFSPSRENATACRRLGGKTGIYWRYIMSL